MTRRSVCQSPVYLILPFMRGWRRRVRMTFVGGGCKRIRKREKEKNKTDELKNCEQNFSDITSCGYVMRVATHFAAAALANIPGHSPGSPFRPMKLFPCS